MSDRWDPSDPNDIVNMVYGELCIARFPNQNEYPRLLAHEINENVMLRVFKEAEATVTTWDLNSLERRAVRQFFEMKNIHSDGKIQAITISYNVRTHRYICIDDPQLESLHGESIAPDPDDDLIIVDRMMILSEVLLQICQNRIASRILEVGGTLSNRFRLEMKRRGSRTDYHSRYSDSPDLEDDRWAILYNMFSVIDTLCNLGELQVRTLKKIIQTTLDSKKVYEITGIRTLFDDVVFDNTMSAGKINEIERVADRLRSKGLIFKIDGLSIRFVDLEDKGVGGTYRHDSKLIEVSRKSPTAFVHEFAHALDYANGRLSDHVLFRRIYDKYVLKVSSYLEELPGSEREYYLSPTEVFSRVFEIFVYNVDGPSILLNDLRRSDVHPNDDEIKKLVSMYFPLLLYPHYDES